MAPVQGVAAGVLPTRHLSGSDTQHAWPWLKIIPRLGLGGCASLLRHFGN